MIVSTIPAASSIEQSLENTATRLAAARKEIGKVIFGQNDVVDKILITLISGGHVLLIGVPGVAKTLMVETVAKVMGLDSARIQCTPDLMPADILGSEVLEQGENGKRSFRFIPGPVFTQFLMADEINRASPRTQSALLQAMQEGSVTVSGHKHSLPKPFHVLATQNPIEQEGTYPLPEAQLDRFLMQVNVHFPDAAVERTIIQQAREQALHGQSAPTHQLSIENIFQARKEILSLYMADNVEAYLVQLVMATRYPAKYDSELADWLHMGCSPRGSIALDRCARAHAWLAGHDFVSPDDIQAVLADTFRHRLSLSFSALTAGVTVEHVMQRILDAVPVA